MTYTPEEQKANRTAWVEALTSGEYAQGQGWLRTTIGDETEDDRFCCLGVLCDISGLGEWRSNPDPSQGMFYVVEGSIFADTNLPEAVREWAGLRTPHGTYDKGEDFNPKDPTTFADQQTLTMLNDNGADFEEIAAMVAQERGILVA